MFRRQGEAISVGIGSAAACTYIFSTDHDSAFSMRLNLGMRCDLALRRYVVGMRNSDKLRRMLLGDEDGPNWCA